MKVAEVSAGLWHTVFITHEGDVYSTGGNQFGQLGNPGEQAEV
jgi:alpha-tubulin suppressor-like RCC1 family protein